MDSSATSGGADGAGSGLPSVTRVFDPNRLLFSGSEVVKAADSTLGIVAARLSAAR